MKQFSIKEISAEFWPTCFKILEHPNSYVLHSGILSREFSRYSYAGFNPSLMITSIEDEICILENGILRKENGNPIDRVGEFLNDSNLDSDFFSGAMVGFWGYDLKNQLEMLNPKSSPKNDIPECFWMLCESQLVWDWKDNKVWAIGTESGLDFLELLAKQEYISPEKKSPRFTIAPTETQTSYAGKISQIRELIADGYVYEANLTQRFDISAENTSTNWTTEFFKLLTEESPAPFSAILKTENFTIVSSSPELFLDVEDFKACVKPIKGTRARSGNFDEDESAFLELKKSEKDRAENLMIVDLMRNDLGKIAIPKTVEVQNLFDIETYETVFQMVSTIRAGLAEKTSVTEVIKACFPPGSMTGAPKVSAMKILDSLEPYRRGIYSGALGMMDAHRCRLSVVIRTLIMQGERGYFQTGGAIVWDSIAEKEFEECLQKAEGILRALRRMGRVDAAL